MEETKYKFSWDLLGDIALGRPNLGPDISLKVYRLMQFTLRDILEQDLGTEKADKIFYDAGKLAGTEFYKNVFQPNLELEEFISGLQQTFVDLKIGVLRIEQIDMEKGVIVLTVSEDVDCSGLPNIDSEICVYDEGFIAGLLESYTGLNFKVKEVDCWCSGDRTCRFRAETTK
ncbi:MAG: V4R domain-containing protein [Sedimentisphaeraceae bacterium JB056]